MLKLDTTGSVVWTSPVAPIGASDTLDVVGFDGFGRLLLAGEGLNADREARLLAGSMTAADGTLGGAGSWPDSSDDSCSQYWCSLSGRRPLRRGNLESGRRLGRTRAPGEAGPVGSARDDGGGGGERIGAPRP